MGERLGHGWFLKKTKQFGAWVIDPFNLELEHGSLVAHRSGRRLMILKQHSYHLDHLKISPMRMFTQEEFSEVVLSSLASNLSDEFTLSRARCFDIEFGAGEYSKTMTVIGTYNETVQNLHRNMVMHSRPGEPALISATGPTRELTIEGLLGHPPAFSLADLLATPANSSSGDGSPDQKSEHLVGIDE